MTCHFTKTGYATKLNQTSNSLLPEVRKLLIHPIIWSIHIMLLSKLHLSNTTFNLHLGLIQRMLTLAGWLICRALDMQAN